LGLEGAGTDVLARVVHGDGSAQVARLTLAAPSLTVTAAPGHFAVAATYLYL
jgi:hypothetical protein